MELKHILTFENLLEAHELCRSGKQHKRGTIMFEMEIGNNISKLAKELANKTYKLGKYKTFRIYDPKERLIEALSYKDRVVLMCFCKNAVEPKLENRMIHDNAASRKGKGTDFAVHRLHGFLQKMYINTGSNNFYFLKCDIAKYFPSIDHNILLDKLRKCGFSEDEMWFMEIVIRSRGKDVKGIPLGNQTSQWFALLYLDEIDRLIKEKLRVAGYVRYMDDFVLLGENKEFLQLCKAEIQNICAQKLQLKLNAKTQIAMVRNGIDFLGYSHKLTATGKIIRSIRASARKRQKRYLKAIAYYYMADAIDEDYLAARQTAFLAHSKGTRDSKFLNNKLNSLKKAKKFIKSEGIE
jgi:RNA-directed DNA polymerase